MAQFRHTRKVSKHPKRARPRCPRENKIRYPTERVANQALNTIWKAAVKGQYRGEKMPCRTYKCKSCRGYHLTSQARKTG